MTVNHGGNLSEEYFRAYLSLVMNSRNYNLEKAKEFMLETFFKGNLSSFGPVSYASYINTVNSMSGN
ncbi:hypothetical protein [Sporosarcina sp. D27]|uniref:hypothetical protein n=1 Tax=Sporosarcina sp. D27 TaxID=1382305 RepID=UPI00046FECFD|nr:hypothetical protein [Sporosarcina sp. D27]